VAAGSAAPANVAASTPRMNSSHRCRDSIRMFVRVLISMQLDPCPSPSLLPARHTWESGALFGSISSTGAQTVPPAEQFLCLLCCCLSAPSPHRLAMVCPPISTASCLTCGRLRQRKLALEGRSGRERKRERESSAQRGRRHDRGGREAGASGWLCSPSWRRNGAQTASC
jgi:hypothetical protein